MTWNTPPLTSDAWTARITKILDAVKACNNTFIVARSMMSVLSTEHGEPRPTTVLRIGERTFLNFDSVQGEEQEFDTIYWQCEYWRCDCDACQAGDVCYCDSLNVPTMGLHKLIIPPWSFDLDQAEIYTVLRLDGLSPADAAEAATLL